MLPCRVTCNNSQRSSFDLSLALGVGLSKGQLVLYKLGSRSEPTRGRGTTEPSRLDLDH